MLTTKSTTSLILRFAGALIFSAPAIAWGNAGPVARDGQIAGDPIASESGEIIPIDIVREKLDIDLTRLVEPNGLAHVDVVYQLGNDGTAQTLDLLFATGAAGVEGFSVSLDGTSIESQPCPGMEIPESWRLPESTPGIDSAKPVSFWVAYSRNVTPVRFTVLVPPGDHELRVSYDAETSRNGSGYPTVYHQFAYVLAPARSWRSFGGLDLKITIPEDWRFSSSLMLVGKAGLYLGGFEGLPGDAITLTLQAPAGNAYSILHYGAIGILGLLVLVGPVVCGVVGFRSGKRRVEANRSTAKSSLAGGFFKSVLIGILWAVSLLAAGVAAIFAPASVLPAGQAANGGWPYLLFALFFVSFWAAIIGTVLTQTLAFFGLAAGRRTSDVPRQDDASIA